MEPYQKQILFVLIHIILDRVLIGLKTFLDFLILKDCQSSQAKLFLSLQMCKSRQIYSAKTPYFSILNLKIITNSCPSQGNNNNNNNNSQPTRILSIPFGFCGCFLLRFANKFNCSTCRLAMYTKICECLSTYIYIYMYFAPICTLIERS